MITDERLDAVVRSALDWEARSAAARQLSLSEQSRRIAERAASKTAMLGPRATLAPAGLALTRVMLVLLLLLGLLAAAYVGAQLLRPDPRLPQSAFGFSAECDLPPRGGLAFDAPGIDTTLSVVAPDGPDPDHESDYHTLYSDGRYVQDVSRPGESRASSVAGSRIRVRRLKPEGVSAMLARVADEGIAPGCRTLSTEHASGELYAVLPQGGVELSWWPGATLVRAVTPEEELTLVALVDDLVRPESWLPADSWLDPVPQAITPRHWLISLTLEPEDEITSAVRDAFDPEQQLDDGATLLCRVADMDDALATARAQENGTGGALDMAGIQPVFGTGYDCAALATDLSAARQPRPTQSPAAVVGDLSGVAPCSLVMPESLALLGADAAEPRRSRLPLGRAAHGCMVFDSSETYEEPVPDDVIDLRPAGYRVMLTLYPIRLARLEAEEVLGAVLGSSFEPLDGTGSSIWIRRCADDSMGLPCSITMAGWSSSHLLIFEFTPARVPAPTADNVMNREPLIREPLALSFAEAVLAAVD